MSGPGPLAPIRRRRTRDSGGQWTARPEARPRGHAPLRTGAHGMWALRAAVRPGARLSRVVRGCGAPKAALPLPPCPKRTVAAFRGGAGGPEGREGGRWGPGANGWRSRAGEEEEPEDAEEEEEEEELLRRDPLLPAGTQRVFLIHPEVKWGPRKPQGTRGNWERGRRLGRRGAGRWRLQPIGRKRWGGTPRAGAHRLGTAGAGLLGLKPRGRDGRGRGSWGRGADGWPVGAGRRGSAVNPNSGRGRLT